MNHCVYIYIDWRIDRPFQWILRKGERSQKCYFRNPLSFEQILDWVNFHYIHLFIIIKSTYIYMLQYIDQMYKLIESESLLFSYNECFKCYYFVWFLVFVEISMNKYNSIIFLSIIYYIEAPLFLFLIENIQNVMKDSSCGFGS